MKTFLPTFLAVLVAAGLALFLYDHFVLEPRLVEVGEKSRVSLEEARQEAKQIATELETSVDQTVADARSAFEKQVQDEDARRTEIERQAEQMRRTAQAADALARASVVKVAVVEHYMNMGQWPAKTADVGLGSPADFAGGPVQSIHLEPNGVIAISLQPDVAPGAKLRLVPRTSANGMVEWTCRASSYPDAERLTACQP